MHGCRQIGLKLWYNILQAVVVAVGGLVVDQESVYHSVVQVLVEWFTRAVGDRYGKIDVVTHSR